MALAADMPQLEEDAAILGMHGIGDALPANDLLVGIDAGRTEIAAALDRDWRGLRNLQAPSIGALPVIFDHHVTGHVARLIRTEPGERRRNDTVRERNAADLNRGKQLGHAKLLSRESRQEGHHPIGDLLARHLLAGR